ncbi:MAG: ribosome silencing factor [Mariprofundaceae bacterium]|nr:ribosome silencing factor [Mariprofundaceae bacterium]
MRQTPRIGVFGGSFDPPHEGHLALAETAIKRLCLDELWVIPVGQAIHRSLSAGITAQQRLQLVAAMFRNTPKTHVLDWEVSANAPVPSCDTLARIQQAWPAIMPIFLLGMDAWQKIEQWVDYPIHRKLCNIAVFLRVGITPCRINGWKTLDLATWQTRQYKDGGHVVFLSDGLPDVSATHIRKQLRCGHILLSTKKQGNHPLLNQWYGRKQNTEEYMNNITVERLSDDVLAALEDKKGMNIIQINVQGRCDFADRFIIATGRSGRQLDALAQSVSQVAHALGLPAKIEGRDGMEWLLVDLGDVVVHLFLPETRENFQLERLWARPESDSE